MEKDKKYTIQVIVGEHAYEIEMKADFALSLQLGDMLDIEKIVANAQLNAPVLVTTANILNMAKEVQDKMSEQSLIIYEINEIEKDVWLQIIVSEPINLVNKKIDLLKEKALVNPNKMLFEIIDLLKM